MPYTAPDHTFVVCAYKDSPYLLDCIESIEKQTVRSNIIVSTSTPNDYIRNIADEHGYPLYVNTGRHSIADDWNYGYMQCTTPLITIVHQDDVYAPDYLEKVLSALNQSREPLIAFTDYRELREGEIAKPNFLVRYKMIMLSPLRLRALWGSKFVRRRILSLGCSICCPSVTFVADALPKPVFEYGFLADLDWQAWEKLSKLRGAFVYIPEPLMYHRIHQQSETSRVLHDNGRTREDLQMFRKFWPGPIAKLLARLYSVSEKSNGN